MDMKRAVLVDDQAAYHAGQPLNGLLVPVFETRPVWRVFEPALLRVFWVLLHCALVPDARTALGEWRGDGDGDGAEDGAGAGLYWRGMAGCRAAAAARAMGEAGARAAGGEKEWAEARAQIGAWARQAGIPAFPDSHRAWEAAMRDQAVRETFCRAYARATKT